MSLFMVRSGRKSNVVLILGAIIQSVLQLEIDRRDNDIEIVAVCYSMVCIALAFFHW